METYIRNRQFDEIYKNICMKRKFYLFGAGDYGSLFFNIVKDEIEVCGYIDNNKHKQEQIINGLTCYGLEQINRNCHVGIIVTMSQIARKNSIVQLNQYGFKRGMDYFTIEEFLSVYYVYRYNRVYFTSISFLPSTICNLNCKHCLNFNPYANQFYVRDLADLIKDVDLFFSCVDRIMLFHISGGEPLLYAHIAELIRYVSEHYGDRIDRLRTVTNGTIVPNEEILKTLNESNVEITVDDYRDSVPQYGNHFVELIQSLQTYHIKYSINKAAEWIDLAPERTDFSCYSEKQMRQHFMDCCQSWQELRDGKLFLCNYAAYASVAGLCDISKEEVFDLSEFNEGRKKQLVEFRLGYNEKGYTNFCRHCSGFSDKNRNIVKPAVQIQRSYSL